MDIQKELGDARIHEDDKEDICGEVQRGSGVGMANLKTVLEGGLEQGCPSLRATKQRLSGGGGL